MIHSKNHSGFTLIEVLLALSIMAMILSPILISQSSIIFSVGYFKDQLQRTFLAKNYLAVAHRHTSENKKIGPLTIENPPTTLSYSLDKTSGSIAKQFKDIYRETVHIEWTENTIKRHDTLISFIFKPEKKTEQKA